MSKELAHSNEYQKTCTDLIESEYDNSMRTYVTLLTSDGYEMGMEALIYSWYQARSAYPFLVLYTNQVSTLVLDKLRRSFELFRTSVGIELQCVEAIPVPPVNEDSAHVPGWVNSGYTKLHIFALEQYEKIVYVDADALILENIDELFGLDCEFAAAADVFPPDRFNAGVLVVKPNVRVFEELMLKTRSLRSYDGGDTGFLNLAFPDWYQRDASSRLSFGYNAQRTMYWLVNEKNPGYWNAIKPLKVLHFSSNPKPWEDPARKGTLEMLWWEYYIASRIPVASS